MQFNFKTSTLFIGIAVLAACETVPVADPAAPSGFVQITQRSDFVTLIEGNEFRGDGSVWSISGDGRMFGQFQNGMLEGTWEWREGAWCRTYVLADNVKPENCQNIFVNGREVMFIKDRGAGDQSTETLTIL